MAASNIKEVKPIFTEKIGARILAVAEVVFPKEYKTEGCELSETQLKECGLTNGTVDCGWVISAGNAAKNAAGGLFTVTTTNPSATPYPKEEAQVVKIQNYETESGAHPLKEVANAGEVNKEAKLIVAFIGR